MSANLIASLLALVAVGINLYLIYTARNRPLAQDTHKLLRTISIVCLAIAIIVITFAPALNLH